MIVTVIIYYTLLNCIIVYIRAVDQILGRRIGSKIEKQILIIMPNINYNTPIAANVWGKNLAAAFVAAGFKTTVLYMGSQSKSGFKDFNHVAYHTTTRLDSILMSLPKIRSLILPRLLKKYISRYGKYYDYILPLEGPYFLSREKYKVQLVKEVGAKYLFAILEHPRRNAKTKIESEFISYMRNTANLYDVIMPITTHIKDLYLDAGSNTPIFLNPIIVDTKQFTPLVNKLSYSMEVFLYSGNLVRDEEVVILLNEFATVYKKHPQIKLKVVGGGNRPKETKLLLVKYKLLCHQLGIADSVEFTGRVAHDKVLEFYREVDALLLPRPFREYSQAGFPTKLGEYLATSKPVIAYSTGDIPLYLRDGISAYLVDNDKVGSFAKRMIEAIVDQNALNIGKNGALVARNSFSIEATAKRIGAFFKNLHEDTIN